VATLVEGFDGYRSFAPSGWKPPAALLDEVDPFHGEDGDVRVVARTVAQGTGTHDYGAGEIRYDLSDLDFTGRDEQLRIDAGVGAIRVVLPPDVDVEVDAATGAGSLRILDREDRGGVGLESGTVDLGADGRGGGELELDLEIGIGDVEVTRAAA
jgi:predicted membrane protein